MKKLLVMAAAACFAVSAFISCGSGSSSIKTDEDSVSYAVGVNYGTQFKDDPVIQVNAFIAGIKDAYAGKEKVNVEDINRIVNEYFTVKQPEKNKVESEAFLAKAEKNANVKKTDSGLLYEVIVAGDPNVKPTANDVVKVIYVGTKMNGKEFDSSKGDTVEFALNRVIPGWSEGIQQIGKGGKVKLWIPSDLAYGEQGTGGNPIGPNEALMFDVDLVDVVLPEAEVDAAQ